MCLLSDILYRTYTEANITSDFDMMLTFSAPPFALYSHDVSKLLFFCIFGCQPFTSSFPFGCMFALGKGGNEGESCSELTVQNLSKAYLVVSQTVSLPSFKMQHSVLDISSVLHSKSCKA